MREPSALKDTPLTVLVCPFSLSSCAPVCPSHTTTLPSQPPPTICVPSLLNATLAISMPAPCNLKRCSPVRASQTIASPGPLELGVPANVSIRLPSLLKVTCVTSSSWCPVSSCRSAPVCASHTFTSL